MDQEQTDRFGRVVLFIVTVGGSLLLILNSLLYASSHDITGFFYLIPLLLALALILYTGRTLYHVYLRTTGRQSVFPDEVQQRDSVETMVDISLPYLQSFDLCKQSIYFLSGGAIASADEKRGVIEGWVWGPDPSETGIPNFTITVGRVSPWVSHIHIHFIIPRPNMAGRGHSYLYDLLVLHYHILPSQNEVNVRKVRDFLLEYAGKAEGSPPGVPDYHPAADSRTATRGRDPAYPDPVSSQRFTVDGKNPFRISPVLSAVLSTVIPGLGQSYQGRYDLGLLIAFGAGGGLLIAIVPGIVVWVYGIYEAYTTAGKINDGIEPFRPASVVWMAATIGTALAFFAVAYLFISFFGPLGALGYNTDAIVARFGTYE